LSSPGTAWVTERAAKIKQSFSVDQVKKKFVKAAKNKVHALAKALHDWYLYSSS
jgi:hypothetical protein